MLQLCSKHFPDPFSKSGLVALIIMVQSAVQHGSVDHNMCLGFPWEGKKFIFEFY